jgi:hypothetical protein
MPVKAVVGGRPLRKRFIDSQEAGLGLRGHGREDEEGPRFQV